MMEKKRWWNCVQTDIHRRNVKRQVKKQSLLGEVYLGGEGMHWTVVPSKKKESRLL